LITICSDDININNTTPSQTIVYQGGGGISSGTVSKYLYGDRKAINDIPVLVDYIDTKYATKTEIEQLHERLDLIQAQVHYYNGFDSLPIDVLTIGIRAKRTGETIKYDGYVCNPENCIKVE